MDGFKVRLDPTVNNKKHIVFKLHKDDEVSWTEAEMRRENDYQPWQIKFGSGRTSRRFKAVKEGGVSDNASYYVFYKSGDGYEACPVEEFYNVSATQRYKTLTAEEAEQKFDQRHKMLNLFSVMHLKKNGDIGDDGPSGSGSKNFKVSELDEWDESGDDEDSENEGQEDDLKKKIRKKKNIKKEDPDDVPEEGREDSDEGDFEQREVDYMSDSSSESDDPEQEKDDVNDVKGIAEEQALRDLLSSDEEGDAEDTQRKANKSTIEATSSRTIKQDPDENGSDESSDSDDYDVDEEKMDSLLMTKGLPSQLSMVKPEVKQEVDQPSKQPTTSVKRKLSSDPTPPVTQAVKRPCPETSSGPANSQEKLVEDLIRKYLSRKPMTLKNLLKDIRSKLRRTNGMTPEMDNNLVNMIAVIMRRLGPEKQRINDLTYFSLKST